MEESGKGTLAFNGSVDTRAPNGRVGTLLLDPTNIFIANDQTNATTAGMSGTDSSADSSGGNPFAATGTAKDSLLTVGTLQSQLSTTDVAVVTTNPTGTGTGNITVVDPVTWNTANTLQLLRITILL